MGAFINSAPSPWNSRHSAVIDMWELHFWSTLLHGKNLLGTFLCSLCVVQNQNLDFQGKTESFVGVLRIFWQKTVTLIAGDRKVFPTLPSHRPLHSRQNYP